MEHPEASFMYRYTYQEQKHHSGSDSFQTGENSFDNCTLNYLSLAYPFRLGQRNFVFSANYQEAYDFKQEFSAESIQQSESRQKDAATGDYKHTQTQHFDEGVAIFPADEFNPVPFEVPITGEGDLTPFSKTSNSHNRDTLISEGVYEEKNTMSDIEGWNATFGLLWAVTRQLRLGFTLDLPWTADADQEKSINNTVTTYNESRSQILNVTQTDSNERKSIEIEFPAYWAVGAVWHWNNNLFNTLDISQTRWSDFSYKAEGEDRLNPLDGTPHGENAIDDCWSIRLGRNTSGYCNVLKSRSVAA